MADKKYNINSAWLKGVGNDQAARQRRADLVLSGHAVLDELEKILISEIVALEKTSLEAYDKPNWAFREADRQGQLRSFRKTLDILKRTPINA